MSEKSPFEKQDYQPRATKDDPIRYDVLEDRMPLQSFNCGKDANGENITYGGIVFEEYEDKDEKTDDWYLVRNVEVIGGPEGFDRVTVVNGEAQYNPGDVVMVPRNGGLDPSEGTVVGFYVSNGVARTKVEFMNNGVLSEKSPPTSAIRELNPVGDVSPEPEPETEGPADYSQETEVQTLERFRNEYRQDLSESYEELRRLDPDSDRAVELENRIRNIKSDLGRVSLELTLKKRMS